MRVLALILLGLIGLAAATWASVPVWLPAVVRTTLADVGISNVELDVERPTLDHLRIPAARLDWGDYRFHIEGAVVSFEVGALLGGRIGALDVQRLDVRQLTTRAPAAAAALPVLPAPELLWDHPIDAVRVETVNVRLDDPPLEVVGRLELTQARTAYGFANVAAGDLLGLTVTGDLARIGRITSAVTLPGREQPLAQVTGSIDAAGDATVQGSLSLTTPDFALLDPLLGIATDAAELSAAFDASYHDTVPAATGSYTLRWTGALPQHAELATAGTIAVQDDALRMTFAETTRLAVSLSEDPVLSAVLNAPVNLSLRAERDGVELSGGMQATIPAVDLDGTTLAYQGGWLDVTSLTSTPAGLRLALSASGLVVIDAQQIPSLVRLEATFAGADASGTATLEAPGTTVSVPVSFRHDLDRGSGSARFDARFGVNPALLATLLPGADLPVEIERGNAHLRGQAEWRTDAELALNADAQLTLGALAGTLLDNPFAKAAGTLAIRYDETAWRVASDDLAIGELDVGFPVTAIAASGNATAERVSVSSIRGRALGGTFRAGPFDYGLERGNAVFDLHLEALQLADVLALEGEDITGTGVLNGKVPITIDDDVITVTGGELSAAAPGGVVRYADATALAASAGQPGLDFALRALSDFSYSKLSASVDYDRDGTLRLGVALQGTNPAIEKGRPIHYNLNVTENLPDLMKSLQLSDELSEGIRQKLNR